MRRSFLLPLITAFVVSACSLTAPPNTPTPTLVPSETPTPSDTPTATRRPSATPDFPATEAVSATRTADYIDTYGSILDLAGFTLSDGELVAVQRSLVVLQITDAHNRRTWDVMSGSTVGNFVFNTDITWSTTTGLSGCAIYFLGDGNFGDGKFALFRFWRLSGRPTWESYLLQYNQRQGYLMGPLLSSPHINVDEGATNNFTIVVDHPNVTIYANGERLSGSTLPASMTEGNIAFGLSHESGSTTCRFENAWVWELPASED